MTTALAPTDDKPMTFVPYGSSDQIKLSVSIIQNMVAVPTRSGATCTKRDALRFMMMCQARRLNPFEGDAFLIGYDGKDGPQFSLITAHQAFLKRAEIHPEFDGMRSGIIVLKDEETGECSDIEGDFHLPNQTVVGGWATVYFKNRAHPISRRVRMARFNKGRAQWNDDPAGMIVKCAEADALRSSFPTMLGGLYMQDEVTLDVKSRTVDVQEVSRLVESVPAPEQVNGKDESEEAEAGLAPVDAARRSAANLQDELAAIVSPQFSFEEWRAWAVAEKHIRDAELPSFDLVPDALAKRLITAKADMLQQLAKRKA